MFNARKTDTGERRLDSPIYRFLIKCPDCTCDITFRTDPQNRGCVCESGAKQPSPEPWLANNVKGMAIEGEAAEPGPIANQEKSTNETNMQIDVADALHGVAPHSIRLEGLAIRLKSRNVSLEHDAKEKQDERGSGMAGQAFSSSGKRKASMCEPTCLKSLEPSRQRIWRAKTVGKDEKTKRQPVVNDGSDSD